MRARGNWNDVWSNFDQRRKAKAGDAANEGGVEDGAGEPDMCLVMGRWRRSEPLTNASNCADQGKCRSIAAAVKSYWRLWQLR